MRTITTFLIAVLAAIGCAQFKVDPQKIPIVQAKRRALIIGASDYQFLGKLTYASSDAARFRDALVAGFNFKEDAIRVISDAVETPEKPTAETIKKELKTMLADPILDKGDLFILFFSGHGIATEGHDYLCSTDSRVADVKSTGLQVKDVIQQLVDAKLRNVVIVADACRAGDQNDFGLDLYELAKKANIAVLLGCEPGKKSYEVPQLKSGAFTYFLLKALGNPKNRTESGGLWTSKIAQSVQKSVYEYTRHDYGDNAQRPVSFADPTSDVMLAKFIDRPDPSKPNPRNEDLAMVTDRGKISDQMRDLSLELFEKNDYAGCLEANNQALSLDPNNFFAAYYASMASTFLGHSGEHEKFCDILKNSADPYFRNLGFVQSDSRATSISERTKALEAFWESSPKDETHAMIVWGKARTYLSLLVTKSLLQKMLPDLRPGTRVSTFFEGEIAVADGKLEDGLAKYRAAAKGATHSNYLTEEELTVIQFPILRQLRRDDELKQILRDQFAKDKVSPMIWVTAASQLKEMGNRDAALAIVKKGIKEPGITEQQIVLSSLVMGAALPDIVEDLEALVKAMPFSWRVRTVAAIARGIKNKNAEATAKAFEEAERYCDDELEIISLTYSIDESIFDDATKNLGVPEDKFSSAKELFRIMFFNRADRIGTDSQKWFQLGELGLSNLQGPGTLRLFKKYLRDFNANSELGSEFYTMLFQLATTTEDDELVKFSVYHPALAEPDRTDVRLLYAAYLISRGDYDEAKAVFGTVGEVTPANDIVKSSLTAIFKARTGDLAGLRKFLAQDLPNTEGNLIAKGAAALVLSDLGDNEGALESLALFLKYQATLVASVPLRCVERYFKILKSKGRSAEADEGLFTVLKFNQSSPSVVTSFFGSIPGIENFVGTFSADTKWLSDQAFDSKNPTHKDEYQTCAIGAGHVDMSVSNDGTIKGTMQIVGGESFVVTGTVDRFGNLRGKGVSKTHIFDVEAKLIGNEFKKSETFKKSSIGQMIQVFDEKGLVTHWMLPASVLKP